LLRNGSNGNGSATAIASQLPRKHSPLASVVMASKEIAGPLLTSLVIALIAVSPALVLTELRADFMQPLVLAYALTVCVSMLVALVVAPALSAALFVGAGANPKATALSSTVAEAYAKLFRSSLLSPKPVLLSAAAIVAVGLLLLPQTLDAPLLPALKDRDIVVRMKAAPGTSLPAMTRIVTAASKEVGAIPGVRSVGAHVGRASNSDLVSSVDTGDLWVGIAPQADYDATLAAIERAVKANPSVISNVIAYPNLRVQEVGSGGQDQVVVRVYGRNYEVLQAKAETVAKVLGEVPGVVSPQVRLPIVEPTVEVEVNVDKASAKGVKPGDVRRAAATQLSSITAGSLFQEQKIFDVVVWGVPGKRDSLSSVQDVLIDAPNDTQVRLGDVAEVRIRPNPSVIKHDAVSRYIDVTASIQGASLKSVNTAIEARLKQIGFPSEHHVELMGESAERQQAQWRLLLCLLAAIVVIYFVLQARTNSWRVGAVLFVSLLLPLAASLVVAALLGKATSALAMWGLLPALVLGARGGLLFTEHLQRLHGETSMANPGAKLAATPSVELLTRAAQERFEAVFLGTVASALVLVPLLDRSSASGLEIASPLAAIALAGLLAAAFANLFVVPALMWRFVVQRPLAAEDAPVTTSPAKPTGLAL
jgi:Cu/Ag efflux pump CusA